MALVLTGTMIGMRPVGGVITEGERKGEEWAFLSMEIAVPGKVYSCQLRDKDKQFVQFVDVQTVKDGTTGKEKKKYTLKQDWTDHRVKVSVTVLTAGEREIKEKDGTKRTIMQVRMQVKNVCDLGDDEGAEE